MDEPRYRLLLVDDDRLDYQDVCDLMAQILDEGSRLDWVPGYDEALAAIGRNHHDAVLIDYRLGDRNGLELLREARARGCNMPLILLTGQDDREVDLMAMEAGAADFLIKGRTDAETLERSLRYAIRHKRIEDQLLLARAEAETASRAKSTFLAHISHEIRTPMNGVVGMAELLMQTPLDPAQQEYAATIRTGAEALLTLINDVLDYSRIEAGRLTLERVPFDLGRVVEEVVDLLAPLAHRKGLRLASQVSAALPDRLLGDPVRIRQVLTNLVGNAVKFTESGEVNVRAGLVGETGPRLRLRLAVEDTGPGIPPNRHASIFDSFAQADDQINRRYGGTGLGLAISRQIVELMGGSIAIDSLPGRGSTFSIELALPRAEGEAAARVRPPLPPAGQRILVAESGATIRRILCEYLHSWGFRVVEAADARAALEALRSPDTGEPFALALIDTQLVGTDGASLARSVRSDAALGAVRLVSLYPVGPGAAAADPLGDAPFDASVAKPVRRSQLLNTLLEQLTAPRPGGVAPAGRTRPRSHPEPSLADLNLNVLVVDDSETNRRVATLMLARWGCRVETASTGREAVALAERTAYDAILMDVQMPEMDGLEATETIRAWEHGRGRHTPILALTAHAQEEDRRRCLDAGMDTFLRKPIRPQELFDLLAAWARPASRPAAYHRPAAAAPAAGWASRLEELCGDDASLRAEILRAFLTEADRAVAGLEDALVRREAGRVSREAHRLKGNCLTVGVEPMARACWGLEELGRRGEFTAASALLSQMRSHLHQLRSEMRLALTTLSVEQS